MDRNPSAYLATIVKNCCMTYHQRRNRLSMRSLFDFEGALAIEPVDNIDDLKEWESDDFFASVVQPEIDELSPNEIKVLHLRYQEGLTFDEIASQLDKQQGTVRSWFRRALLKLRVNCAADGDE
jgi:RNA polymerase sigma factor (sigma-70 family)